MAKIIYVQVHSTRLVTPHSLWPTNTDTCRLLNILLKNITVIQNVCCTLQTVNFLVSIFFYQQFQWIRLETLLSLLSVPVVTWRWSRLLSTDMLILGIGVYKCYLRCWWWSSTEPVNRAGDTPLSLACTNGHLDTLKYFVNEHHCDPRSKYCQLPVHALVYMYRYTQHGWWHPNLPGMCLWPLGHSQVPCEWTSLWS